MRTRTWRHERLLFIAVLLAIGCADSTLRPHDDGSGDAATMRDASSTEGDAPADGGRRVKPRTVMATMPPIASRTLREGPDGRPEYGDITPIDGAKVCIIQRREELAAFEPFETLPEPICVLSSPGQVVRIPGAPAKSDLIITVEHEGMQPLALTNRTSDSDSFVGWVPQFSLIMLEEGASETWIEPVAPSEEGHGTLFTFATSWWMGGPGKAAPELVGGHDVFVGTAPGFVPARGVDLKITPAGGGDPIALLDGELHALSLPPGSARLEFSTGNRHFRCAEAYVYVGLLAEDGVLEVPIVAGHSLLGGPLCQCVGDSDEDELVDLASCRFTSDDAGTP